MTFLLGRKAMLGHEPPTYLRSIKATRRPSAANVQAATVPPVPPPRMTMSNSSGFATGLFGGLFQGSLAFPFCSESHCEDMDADSVCVDVVFSEDDAGFSGAAPKLTLKRLHQMDTARYFERSTSLTN